MSLLALAPPALPDPSPGQPAAPRGPFRESGAEEEGYPGNGSWLHGRFGSISAKWMPAAARTPRCRSNGRRAARVLLDRRTYDDGAWTEIAGRVDRRVTLIILSHPRADVGPAEADEVIAARR